MANIKEQEAMSAEPKATKWMRAANGIKQLIARGDWAPGSRLPTHCELEQEFEVSHATMQQIIVRLKNEGFLISRDRQGIFVSPRPPSLYRIGIVLPSNERENLFWEQMINEAAALTSELDRDFTVYRNIGSSYHDGKEWQLADDLANNRLAGLLILFNMHEECPQEAETYLNHPLPKFLFSTEPHPGCTRVTLDNDGLVVKGIEWLLGRGCERIAGLYRKENSPVAMAFRREQAMEQFYCPRSWQLPIRNEELAEHIVQLLMALPRPERPQGLFIGDDNLTAHALRGLAACGLPADQLPVILSHCNWRKNLPDTLPVEYLGFDIRGILRACVRTIAQRKLGHPAPAELVVPALFSHEIVEHA